MFNKLKYLGILLLILFLIGSICASQTKKYSDESIDYFLELAIGSEYGDNQLVIRKWTQDIKVYFSGKTVAYLESELTKIINDLDELIDTINISVVDNVGSANFVIYFGTGEEYASTMEPHATDYIEENAGFFWVYWTSSFEIFKGSLYIDTDRVETITEAKHVLREEFTQSLGFLKESLTYRTSIFYSEWSTTVAYNQIDKEVIQMLYNEKIKPGMNKNQLIKILNLL